MGLQQLAPCYRFFHNHSKFCMVMQKWLLKDFQLLLLACILVHFACSYEITSHENSDQSRAFFSFFRLHILLYQGFFSIHFLFVQIWQNQFNFRGFCLNTIFNLSNSLSFCQNLTKSSNNNQKKLQKKIGNDEKTYKGMFGMSRYKCISRDTTFKEQLLLSIR